MLLFFAVLQATLMESRRWTAAAFAGAAGAFSYSTGFLLAPIAAACVLLDRGLSRGPRIALAATLGCATFAGFLAVLGIHYVQLGHWNAFFTIQGNYGHRLQNPLATLAELVRLVRDGNEVAAVEGLHVAAAAVLLLGVLVATAVSWKVTATMLDRWAGIYAVLFFVFPLTLGAGVSPVRAMSLLAPSIVVTRWLPWPVLLAWLGVAAWLAYGAGRLYFGDVLI
jgi:hypothetical protein